MDVEFTARRGKVSRALRDQAEEGFARIDAIKGDPIFPEGREQNLAPIREYFK